MKKYPDTVSQVMGILKKNPRGLNILEISEKTGINRMSVAKYLEVLTALETVEVRTMGSAKIYTLSRRIPLSTFLKHTSRYYFVCDENMVIIQLNEDIGPVVRLAPDQMIGKPIHEVIGKRIVNLEECETAIAKALAGELTTLVIEDRLDDMVGYYKIVNIPIEFPDGSSGVLTTSEDITEKRATDAARNLAVEKYRDLVEKIPDIVFSASTKGVLDYIGPQLARYGFVPEELTGKPVDTIIHPDDRHAAMIRLLAARKSHAPVSGILFRAAVPDGRIVWFEASCMARRDDPAAPPGIIGVLRDVTERAGAGPGPGEIQKN